MLTKERLDKTTSKDRNTKGGFETQVDEALKLFDYIKPSQTAEAEVDTPATAPSF